MFCQSEYSHTCLPVNNNNNNRNNNNNNNMEDIFSMVREGNAFHVRVWLDNIENDLNQG